MNLSSIRPRILIDGQHFPALDARILSLRVEQSTGDLAYCELRYALAGTLPGDLIADVSEFSNQFGIEMTMPGGDQPIFSGRVTSLQMSYPADQPPFMTLILEDRLRELRMTRRTRVFNEVSDTDVIELTANQHGLPITLQISGDSPIREVTVQANETDLEFLRERARRIGAELWIEDATLVVRSRESWDTASPLVLSYGERLKHFTVLADLTDQRTALHVTGWDVGEKSMIGSTAEAASNTTGLNHGLSGSALLNQVMGSRQQRIVHTNPLTMTEAGVIARARFEQTARRFVTGHGAAEGSPAIRVGRVLELKGLGKLFDGQYYCVKVRHLFDLQEGYRTEFAVERADLGSAPRFSKPYEPNPKQ
jgi:phage protein D